MTLENLWRRYAAAWSLPEDARTRELAACVADDVTYCDPNSAIEGPSSLSNYMGGFQTSVAGGRFQIASVVDHHGRTLAHWKLLSAEGQVLQSGASFAALDEDGRLRTITGFFPVGETTS